MTDTIWLNANLNRKSKIEPPALRNEKKPLFKRIGLDAVTPPVWLVKSYIEEGTFAMVFGPSGAKKSFLVYPQESSLRPLLEPFLNIGLASNLSLT